MEKPLRCVEMLSLKEMALRKVIVHLLNRTDFLAAIMKFRNMKNCQTVENVVKEKILKLDIPEFLIKQMVDVVRPIGVAIINWQYFHEDSFNLSCVEIFKHDSVKLHFTTEGTVDDRRTAEELVRCDKINVVQRYQMACSYWLEDCIPLLWEELSEKDKEYFYRKNPALQGLQFSWPRIFNGRQSNLDFFLRKTDVNLTSFNQWAFEHSVKMCCKTTAQHFFRKLSHEEREASLMRSARQAFLNKVNLPKESLYDVFCYLLSVMTAEQQMEIVKACPLGVLLCFLDWPRRGLFLEVSSLVWPFIPPRVYGNLQLEVIFRYDKDDFPKFFPDFYKQSPLAFKNFFVCDEFGALHFLQTFFNSEDSESIKVVFRTMDAVDRVRLVFQPHALQLFHAQMLEDKWPLVELCLREATLSVEDRRRLKATFIEHLDAGFRPLHLNVPFGPRLNLLQFSATDPKLKSFYDFLDGTDASVDKIEGD